MTYGFKTQCPRSGCGSDTGVNIAGKLDTHKLPDGWRTCAASGSSLIEAALMPVPYPADPFRMP